jgi:hypothetical protein
MGYNCDHNIGLSKIKDEVAEFVVILDMSGSMSGTPWSQVQVRNRDPTKLIK